MLDSVFSGQTNGLRGSRRMSLLLFNTYYYDFHTLLLLLLLILCYSNSGVSRYMSLSICCVPKTQLPAVRHLLATRHCQRNRDEHQSGLTWVVKLICWELGSGRDLPAQGMRSNYGAIWPPGRRTASGGKGGSGALLLACRKPCEHVLCAGR